ncbi:MAG TPA: M20/M25/M40 family metallo-hydrolase [Nocardioidaceae bacterium]|nr:M20/M25/M40 family metallo-hydrolase [Nocardioidaceae bacterium]
MTTPGPGDRAVDLTAELVALDTTNPALVPGAPGERPAVEHLCRRLSTSGFRTEVVEAAVPGRPSLLAWHTGPRPGRTLVLDGHLDVVGAGAMPDPFGPRVVGDRMTGRGTCDMKAGVAAMVVAAEESARRRTPGTVVLALVADEEHDSIGTEAVLPALSRLGLAPDGCIVGEPTGLDLAAAHRGYAVVEVVLRGTAAHSSQPDLGSNALTHLGRLLGRIEDADTELRTRPAHPVVGHGSWAATVAHAGEAPFTVPDLATTLLERRTVPGESAAAALVDVREMLAALTAADPTVSGLARLVTWRDAWELGNDAATAGLLESLQGALARHGGPAAAQVGFPYWMESAMWQAAGIPTVVCGPAGGGLHADDEWVELAQVRSYAGALVDVVQDFCGG